jgi:hypothetical protein
MKKKLAADHWSWTKPSQRHQVVAAADVVVTAEAVVVVDVVVTAEVVVAVVIAADTDKSVKNMHGSVILFIDPCFYFL